MAHKDSYQAIFQATFMDSVPSERKEIQDRYAIYSNCSDLKVLYNFATILSTRASKYLKKMNENLDKS